MLVVLLLEEERLLEPLPYRTEKGLSVIKNAIDRFHKEIPLRMFY